MYKPKSIQITNIISHKNTLYQFHNGKAVVIVGENRDDPSQKGNGSGKSGLIESIAIAMTGTALRDVKQRELLFNETGSGEIIFTLYNTISTKEMIIIRKLFESKPQQVELWIGGEQKKYADVNEYNKAIFAEIGISKEDFFKFYLITKDNYEPFLKIGDIKKKVIINRFSGADKIDEVEQHIQTDSDLQKQVVRTVDNKILVNKTKQEGLVQQIDLEKSRNSSEAREQLIAEKNNKIGEINMLLTTLQEESATTTKDAGEIDFNVCTFIYRENYNELREFIQKDIDVVKLNISTYEKNLLDIQKEFDEQLKTLQTTQQEISAEDKSISQSIRETKELYNEINNQLAGSITCPNCKHVFSLQSKDFNYEESKQLVAEINITLTELNQSLTDLSELTTSLKQEKFDIDKQITTKQDQIRVSIKTAKDQIAQYQDDIKSLDDMEKEDKKELQVLKDSRGTLLRQVTQIETRYKEQIAIKNTLITEISELSLTANDKVLKQLTGQLTTLLGDDEKLNTEKFNEQIKLDAIEAWFINFKNFKSYLANKSIRNIKDYTNLFLENTGSNIRIAMEGYKVLANKKIKEEITVTVERDGLNEGSYGKFSGGERGRIDICNILAIQELINLNAPSGGVDLLLCDEIFDSIDSKGLECIIQGLQSLQKTIMIVSQVDINSLKEYTVTVCKQNKISTIL